MIKIYVEWYDAYTHDEWLGTEDAIKQCTPLLPCKTIGWLLNEDDDQITICHTQNPMMVMGSLHIPKGCVKRIKRYSSA